MKKVLILLVLASCRLSSTDDEKIRISVHTEPSFAQQTKSLDTVALYNVDNLSIQKEQEELNKLWIENLKSKINYTGRWDDKTSDEYQEVNIEDNGHFTILTEEDYEDQIKECYYLIKAVSATEALYHVLTEEKEEDDNDEIVTTSYSYNMLLKITNLKNEEVLEGTYIDATGKDENVGGYVAYRRSHT